MTRLLHTAARLLPLLLPDAGGGVTTGGGGVAASVSFLSSSSSDSASDLTGVDSSSTRVALVEGPATGAPSAAAGTGVETKING